MIPKTVVRDQSLALPIGQSDYFERSRALGYRPIHLLVWTDTSLSAEPDIASSAVERFTSRTPGPNADAEVYDDRATNCGLAGGKQATS